MLKMETCRWCLQSEEATWPLSRNKHDRVLYKIVIMSANICAPQDDIRKNLKQNNIIKKEKDFSSHQLQNDG